MIIFGKTNFLPVSENEIFHEVKHDGMTSFTDFMFFALKIIFMTIEFDLTSSVGFL